MPAHEDLIAHLARTTSPTPGEATRVVADGSGTSASPSRSSSGAGTPSCGRGACTTDRATEKRPSEMDIADLEPGERGEHGHFLAKEIAEQPRAIGQALRRRVEERFATVHVGGLNMDVREARAVRRVTVLGCGSGWFAGEIPGRRARVVDALAALPGQVRDVLDAGRDTGAVAAVAAGLAACPSSLYIGRRRGWAVAREGAQKLTEVSYVHTEAYAAAELKHGPRALVGPELPTVAVVRDDDLLDENLSTPAEIRARRGPIVAVEHREVPAAGRSPVVPRSEPELDPVLLSVPLQLLACHAGVALGRDVDRPRNLAKSVTVE